MKKIVVPTDFSDCAFDALKVAADISRKSKGVKIELLHTYERPYNGLEIDKLQQATDRREKRRSMEKLINDKVLNGLDVKSGFKIDKNVWEVVNVAPIKNTDLLVMGTHGSKGWKEVFIGSNTQRVVQMAKCPVLTVKSRTKKFDLKEVVFVSDFHKESEVAFPGIKGLLDIFNPKIHLLTINTPYSFNPTHYNESVMGNFAEKFKLKNYEMHIYDERTVEEGLLNFMGGVRADLVCIPTHGRTGFSHLINGSVTESLVNHLSTPVLTTKIIQKKTPAPPIYPLYPM